MENKRKMTNKIMPRAYFNRGYAEMLMYLREHPEADILEEMRMPDGFPLGKWLKETRDGIKYNRFSEKQLTMLKALGISCEKETQGWESMYLKAEDYYQRYGTLEIRHDYCNEDGIMLGAWLDRQKRYYPLLPKVQQEKLTKIGIGKKYGNQII